MTADDKRVPTRPARSEPGAVDAFLKQARGTPPQTTSNGPSGQSQEQSGQSVQTAGTGAEPAAKRSSAADVAAFVGKVRAMAPGSGGGRLIFAMDATASREPSWDTACHIQGEMFRETSSLGGLSIQLAYYRGFGEFHAGDWSTDGDALLRQMTRVRCVGGRTQIERVLRHAVTETKVKRVQAVVFVGDMVEEDVDRLCHVAGELGVLGVPVFCFHEGGEAVSARVLQQIAQLTKGAYCRFDASSAKQLRDLLAAVAVYAAGGRKALTSYAARQGGEPVRLLTNQMNR